MEASAVKAWRQSKQCNLPVSRQLRYWSDGCWGGQSRKLKQPCKALLKVTETFFNETYPLKSPQQQFPQKSKGLTTTQLPVQ